MAHTFLLELCLGSDCAGSELPDRTIPAATGLQDFDRARGRSTCITCAKNIGKGQFRFSYRFKKGNTLADQLRVHATPACLKKLRMATRDSDIYFCRASQVLTEDPDELAMLEAALVALKSTRIRETKTRICLFRPTLFKLNSKNNI